MDGGVIPAGLPDLLTANPQPCSTLSKSNASLVKPEQIQCRVNMVLVGAEGVVENGGVINKLGTCTLAITAHALGCPFYVAAESYKV